LDLSLTVSSIEEAERIYALLSKGGQIFMPMQTTFFASRFAIQTSVEQPDRLRS
jgi:PhnB protein